MNTLKIASNLFLITIMLTIFILSSSLNHQLVEVSEEKIKEIIDEYYEPYGSYNDNQFLTHPVIDEIYYLYYLNEYDKQVINTTIKNQSQPTNDTEPIPTNNTIEDNNTSSPTTYIIPQQDNTPPEIKNINQTPDSQYEDRYVNITFDVIDNVIVHEVRIIITYPNNTTNIFNINIDNYYFNQTYSQVGTYYYYIWADDPSGNTITSTNYSFAIEEIITSGLPGTYLINETNNLYYNFLNGNFDNTEFDINNDTIILNNSLKGNYTSKIFDVNLNVYWNNISWISNGIGELPNNKNIEHNPTGVNMTDNIVLYHFNNETEQQENETTLYDFSNTGHNGTLGANLTLNGKIGGAVEFNGTDNHVIYINNSMEFWDNAEKWSVSMWIYARDTGNCLISKRDDLPAWIWIGEDYRIGFSDYYGVSPPYTENVSSTLPYAVDSNNWTHLTLTRNNTNLSVYKNGVLHTNLTASTSQNGDRPGLGDLQIGRAGTSSANFDGLIDELAFFTRTLSADEIWNMYTRGLISLNLSVSSCDDPNCIGETWIGVDDTPHQNLKIDNNQYFQYKFMFETENLLFTPKLYNITIYYSELDIISPEIINVMDNPDPQDANGFVNITCQINDNYNVNLTQLNISYPGGSWSNISMNKIGTNQYYYNNTYSIIGNYSYHIWTNDTSKNSNKSQIYNFTIQQDHTLPTIINIIDIPDPQDNNWYVNISCDVTDNIDVNIVKINITYPAGPSYNITMNSQGENGYYYNNTYTIIGIYNYFIWVNDTNNNTNISSINNFTIQQDNTPPSTITNLQNTKGENWINWTWNNPITIDFNHTMIYLNGTWMTNTSNSFYNATGLKTDTYIISTQTVDLEKNINNTWINQTTQTLVLYIHNIDTGMNYSTIQKAINSPFTNNGHTIQIDPGVYNENITVNKSLTIKSTTENSNDTIIQTNNSNNNVIEITADYVNISGFTIKNANISGKAGINMTNANHCNISNNNITNNEYGIYLYSSNNNTIIKNNINSNKIDGVYLYSSSNNNTVTENRAYSNILNDIFLHLSHNNIITNNNLTESEWAIALDTSTYNLITNNYAINCDFGIGPRRSSNNTITNNTFNSNFVTGIYLFSSSNNNTITNNTAMHNNNGFVMRRSTGNTIVNNTIRNNNYGISLYNTSTNNTIYNNYFNNTRNAWDDGNNTWNITRTIGMNIIGGSYLGGNYWSDYIGTDTDSDGIGDTNLPYNSTGFIQNNGDFLPLIL